MYITVSKFLYLKGSNALLELKKKLQNLPHKLQIHNTSMPVYKKYEKYLLRI